MDIEIATRMGLTAGRFIVLWAWTVLALLLFRAYQGYAMSFVGPMILCIIPIVVVCIFMPIDPGSVGKKGFVAFFGVMAFLQAFFPAWIPVYFTDGPARFSDYNVNHPLKWFANSEEDVPLLHEPYNFHGSHISVPTVKYYADSDVMKNHIKNHPGCSYRKIKKEALINKEFAFFDPATTKDRARTYSFYNTFYWAGKMPKADSFVPYTPSPETIVKQEEEVKEAKAYSEAKEVTKEKDEEAAEERRATWILIIFFSLVPLGIILEKIVDHFYYK